MLSNVVNESPPAFRSSRDIADGVVRGEKGRGEPALSEEGDETHRYDGGRTPACCVPFLNIPGRAGWPVRHGLRQIKGYRERCPGGPDWLYPLPAGTFCSRLVFRLTFSADLTQHYRAHSVSHTPPPGQKFAGLSRLSRLCGFTHLTLALGTDLATRISRLCQSVHTPTAYPAQRISRPFGQCPRQDSNLHSELCKMAANGTVDATTLSTTTSPRGQKKGAGDRAKRSPRPVPT